MGRIKDRMKPSVLGVGYMGIGPHKCRVNKKLTIAYSYWQNMLRRCYDPDYHLRQPTYKGCSVCDEWLNFQNFAEWVYSNHPQDGERYDLDKDITKEGNKVYSPRTCLFVTRHDNLLKSATRKYKFTSPTGELFEFVNLRRFCKERNLDECHMSGVHSGKRLSHKGWKKAP